MIWRFNPCFLGTCPWTVELRTRKNNCRKVSILVFLELALGPRLSSMTSPHRMSFNPCFLGTCPWTYNTLAVPGARKSFNPCFLGTCPWTAFLSCFTALYIQRFNPCFLGTCPWTITFKSTPCSLAVSFNPCFLGTCPWTSNIVIDGNLLYQFQSLFSWNLPLDFRENYMGRVSKESFNPCFLGTCPWTLRSLLPDEVEIWVSILVFLELALGPRVLCTLMVSG